MLFLSMASYIKFFSLGSAVIPVRKDVTIFMLCYWKARRCIQSSMHLIFSWNIFLLETVGNRLRIEVEYWYKEHNLWYIGSSVQYGIGHEVTWIIGKPVVTPMKTDTCLKWI
jgi:hypothetical protein